MRMTQQVMIPKAVRKTARGKEGTHRRTAGSYSTEIMKSVIPAFQVKN